MLFSTIYCNVFYKIRSFIFHKQFIGFLTLSDRRQFCFMKPEALSDECKAHTLPFLVPRLRTILSPLVMAVIRNVQQTHHCRGSRHTLLRVLSWCDVGLRSAVLSVFWGEIWQSDVLRVVGWYSLSGLEFVGAGSKSAQCCHEPTCHVKFSDTLFVRSVWM